MVAEKGHMGRPCTGQEKMHRSSLHKRRKDVRAKVRMVYIVQ